jgi:hypothetical protein
LECNGAGVVPPATLAEITLNGVNGRDVYYVSLVNGFNVPVQVRVLMAITHSVSFYFTCVCSVFVNIQFKKLKCENKVRKKLRFC